MLDFLADLNGVENPVFRVTPVRGSGRSKRRPMIIGADDIELFRVRGRASNTIQ
jgi:hypothetical protein